MAAETKNGAQTTEEINRKNVVSTAQELSQTNFSRAEADAYGKSLRNKASRASHAGWQPPAGRRDPVDIILEATAGLRPNLLPIRYGRMLQSPFTFFRGAAAVMAADLATTPSTGLYLQACGDCHLMNFGAFATPERELFFDINDFDETLPSPWEWDLKRLATSFVIASLNNKFTAGNAKDMARACIESYRIRTVEYAEMDPLAIWYAHITMEDVLGGVKDEKALDRMRKRIAKAKIRSHEAADFPKLTSMKYGKAYIKDNPPLIYHRTDVDPKDFYEKVDAAFTQYQKTLGDEKKILLDQYKFQDIATKVVGVGSVGTRCSISLLMSANNDPLFLQVKEARPSVFEPYAGKSVYGNPAQRVVIGQKLMQAATDIFLGWSEEVDGAHFFVRQLRDMKIKPLVELFDEDLMRYFAGLCGWALARAHARSGKASIISGYMGTNDKFDDAIAQFAVDYAAQNEADHAALKEAVKDGKLEVYIEEP